MPINRLPSLLIRLVVAALVLGQLAFTMSASAAPPPATSGGSPSDPVAGERFFHDQRAYPNRELPPGALLRARQQLAAGLASGAIGTLGPGGRLTGTAPTSGQATLSQSPWTGIGPTPIENGVPGSDFGPFPISGRVSALAAVDANTVYLGGADGGVWKTTNGGVTARTGC